MNLRTLKEDSMLLPPLLRPAGPADAIGVYSPSGTVIATSSDTQLYERGLAAIRKELFEVIESKHARSQFHHMSGTGRQKATDIHDLFLDKRVGALVPSVGGHTASQILPYLDLEIIRTNPKVFIGFSDSSMLAAYIADRTGLVTYHSAVDVMFGFSRFGTPDSPMSDQGKHTASRLWSALKEGRFDTQPLTDWTSLVPGECEGTLLGGNLHSLEQMIGTPYEPDWSGKIMFWEAGDAPHKIGQMLSHFSNAGILRKIRGMLIGKVSHLKEDFYGANEIMPTFQLIKYLLEGHSFPVVVDADIGHDVENLTLPNGRTAQLVSGTSCHLRIL
jgi:muramoyltetrapeptide carboxypeptidase